MGTSFGKKDREGIKKYGSDKKPTVLWSGPDGYNYSNFFRKFEALAVLNLV